MTASTRTALVHLTRLATAIPEIAVGLSLFTVLRDRARASGPSDRGDTVQWVILTAIGAAIAITVGTIIYTKLTNKANQINVTTPAAGS